MRLVLGRRGVVWLVSVEEVFRWVSEAKLSLCGSKVELVGARVVAPQARGRSKSQRQPEREISPIAWPRHAIRFNAF
jgi:hypothetical protein